MVFARRLDKPTVLEREYREEANFANFLALIRGIRKLAYFALRNSFLEKAIINADFPFISAIRQGKMVLVCSPPNEDIRHPMKNNKNIEKFKSFVDQRMSIPETEWEYFLVHLSERTFERKDYLVRAGDVVDNFYFINTGLVRFFYCTEDGKEFNKHFAMENGFAGSFHSLTLQEPCSFFIQALERTDTIVLPNRLLNELYDRHPCWERFGRKMAEHLVIIKEAREKQLLLDSLDVRYRRFLKEFPGLVDRIPQYHIASYLGVTDVALSRIRQKIK